MADPAIPQTTGLSRPFSKTVRERAERDPAFRDALKEEGLEVPQTTEGGAPWR